MPRRELPIRPGTLVNLGAEALKIAAGMALPFPGGLAAKAVIGAGQKALTKEQNRKRRDSAVRRFAAEADYLRGDLIRIADFVRRTAPDTLAAIAEAHSSEIFCCIFFRSTGIPTFVGAASWAQSLHEDFQPFCRRTRVPIGL